MTETFIIHTNTTEQKDALKAFVKALKMKFEVTTKPYSLEFTEKIFLSEKEIEEGKTTKVNKEDLKQFLGL